MYRETSSLSGAGFTLIELAMIIAVIAIVAVISIPIFRQIAPNIKLDSSARDIASDLRFAQQLAVSEQDIYKVRFNILTNSYIITNSSTGQTIKTVTVNSQTPLIDEASVPDIIDFDFNATGAAINPGSVAIENSENASTTIEVKPSGYVKIID